MMKVLAVDGGRVYRELLAQACHEAGFDVVLCQSGQEALAVLREESIDFVCASMYLNDMSAIELALKIRRTGGYLYTPIALITSEYDQTILEEALAAGITDIFHKDELDLLVIYLQRFGDRYAPVEGRVLYMEDSLSQQKAITAILEEIGLAVDCETDLGGAWKAFKEREYDLVLADVVLEGNISGIKLVNNIRRFPGEKGNIPILAISAFDDISRKIELLNRGANDYISKPVIPEELQARVRGLVHHFRRVP